MEKEKDATRWRAQLIQALPSPVAAITGRPINHCPGHTGSDLYRPSLADAVLLAFPTSYELLRYKSCRASTVTLGTGKIKTKSAKKNVRSQNRTSHSTRSILAQMSLPRSFLRRIDDGARFFMLKKVKNLVILKSNKQPEFA